MIKIFTGILSVIIVLSILSIPLKAQEGFGAILGEKKQNPNASKEEKNVVIGEVDEVTNKKVVVDDKKQNIKTEAVIDNKTKVVGQNKKLLKVSQIKIKDKVALISTDSGSAATDGAKIKKAVKIFVKPASPSAELKRRAVQGIIDGINGVTITLVHQIQRDRTFTVIVDSQTAIKIKGITDSTLDSLQVGQRIVAMGDTDGAGAILAKRIHVIPGKATGIFKRFPIATPSATLTLFPTITSTPSATVSGTPELTPTTTPSVSTTPSATLSPTTIPSSTPTP